MRSLIRASLVLMMIACLSACVTTRDSKSALDSPIYLSYVSVDETHAYILYESQGNSVMSEVQYLINLTRFSEVGFWRNGTVYSGEQAAQWLEYKVGLFGDEIITTKDFIDKVAAYSRKSGKEYVLIQNGRKAPIRDIFHRELERLRIYELQVTREKATEILPESDVAMATLPASTTVAPMLPDAVRV